MKIYGGKEVLLHQTLTSILDGNEWPVSRSDRFILREKAPGIICIGGWVG
jgi:hypothetical protein